MRKLFFCSLCIFVFTFFGFSQEREEVKTYKNAKVKLVTGEIIKAKKVDVNSSIITVTTTKIVSSSGVPNKPIVTFNPMEIEYIEVSKKNYLPFGAVIGGAIAAGVMFGLVEDTFHYSYTLVTDNEYDENGRLISKTSYPTNYEETRTPTTGTKIGIVAGGTVLGGLIGYLIKGGWEKIFPTKNSKGRITPELFVTLNSFDRISFTMNFNF